MSITKRGIVASLQRRGLSVKSVQQLNKLLEAMGILVHYGNGWGTTKAGLQYSIYHSQGLNSDLWHETLIDAVEAFLKDK